MPAEEFKGAIFDLDGVITHTARVHALAWEKMFNEFLKQHYEAENKPFLPFDRSDDYQKYLDGKPRFEGVKSFLESRGIMLDWGDISNGPGSRTICGLGNQKNLEFQEILKDKKPEVFDSSVALIKELRSRGVKVGIASSSRNCKLILELAGLESLFDTRVDGLVSQDLGLKGKPDPDIFVTAAENLGLTPSECMVVEDAISGVQAGSRGNFGLVLGVARSVEGLLLKRFGADLVVMDLAEITIEEVENWFLEGIPEDGWELTYHGFDPGDEKLRETLTTVGNGFIGTRGSFEGEEASFTYYPGTYIAGLFNKVPSQVHGKTIYNNDFVNGPNWTAMELRIGNGPYRSPMSLELLHYQHTLDMRRGVMRRTILCRDNFGHITRIHSERIVSMASPHLCAQRYSVTPVNYSGPITVRSSLDGNVINDGVPRYRDLNQEHLEFLDGGDTEDGIFLLVKTNSSDRRIVMRAKTRVYEDGREFKVEKSTSRDRAKIMEEVTINATENMTYSVDKLVSVQTSPYKWDPWPRDPTRPAALTLEKAATWRSVYTPHVKVWKALWEKVDVNIVGDRFVQRTLRLHIYHLLVTASPHNTGFDAGMPARGLHGEAYRGHIFWDELYIMPFFDLHLAKTARSLLMYRHRRLDAARDYARENGYEGAMYPWQTADDGGEETQEVHYNPANDSWGPDLSRRQRHVSIAVFYNVWEHVHRTGDQSFLKNYGAEMMLDIARFWASIAEYNPAEDRYSISGVMGPDEFHEKLPGSGQLGLTDNAYTNIMVVWLMERTLELLDTLPTQVLDELRGKLQFTPQETDKWRDMTRKMRVIITEDGIISQFDGYMDLKELNWEDYRKRYYSIHRMDRILKAEGDSPDNYKVAKQADVLMTFYVLPPEEVRRILNQLGYCDVDACKLLRDNYEYYVNRTSHGSTLSKVVHAVISSYVRPDRTAWNWFMESMRSDIYDTQGGTTQEGIHTGVMAGTVDVVFRFFAGVELSEGFVRINPELPSHWKYLGFSFCFRKIWYTLEVTPHYVAVAVDGPGDKSVKVQALGEEMYLRMGERREVTTALRIAPPA